MSSSTDVTFALTHAIAYLTRPLIGRYSATTIDLLHFTLERNLSKHYENNWFPNEPSRGSGRRCLTLTASGVPPRPVYFACKAARVNWNDWMTCLGNVEMDVFIDPGRVSVRFAGVKQVCDVWSATAEAQAASEQTNSAEFLADEDEEELFNLIADEIRAPTWMSPILSQFPNVPRRASLTKLVIPNQTRVSKSSASTDSSLLSVSSGHSRSSSFSSISDASGFSMSSIDSASTAATSYYSPAKRSAVSNKSSPFSSRPKSAAPRDANLLPASSLIMQAPVTAEDDGSEDVASLSGRPTCVVVDASKKEVTPYDGGKTTVLTGGVMLGMKVPQTPRTPRNPTTPRAFVPSAVRRNTQWRAVRA